ncbi:hypothetical protein CZ794_03700 [Psychrobacter sp. JB385]|nr:hypothetical protein CZ794_03700 [Psychrobacter sp. JB385]
MRAYCDLAAVLTHHASIILSSKLFDDLLNEILDGFLEDMAMLFTW